MTAHDILTSAERVRDRPETVWQHHGGLALGDTWNLAQWIAARSAQVAWPIRISTHFPKRDIGPDGAAALLPRCLALLGVTPRFQWVDCHISQTQPLPQEWLWNPKRIAYHPTVQRWDGGSVGHICVQFNGVSGGDRKNPPEGHAARIVESFSGNVIVPLGLPMPLEMAVALLGSCRLFIGVCSGMSHVAHSVGCPRIVVQYGQVCQPWQPAQCGDFQIALGTEDAIMLAHAMLKLQGVARG